MLSPIELRRSLVSLDLGGILRETVAVLGRCWLTLVAIFLILMLGMLAIVAVIVLPSVLMGQSNSPAAPIVGATLFVAALAILFLWLMIGVGGLYAAMGGAYLGGALGVRTSLAWGVRRMWALLGSTLLLVVVFLAVSLPLISLAFVGGLISGSRATEQAAAAAALLLIPVLCLVIPVFLVVVLYLAARLGFAPLAVMFEEAGPIRSLQRSWSVTRGHVLRVFGYTVMLALGAIVISISVELPLQLGMIVLPAFGRNGAPASPAQTLIYIVLVTLAIAIILLVSLVVRLFVQIALMILYFDLRRRDEGFGAEPPAAPAGLESGEPPLPPDLGPAAGLPA